MTTTSPTVSSVQPVRTGPVITLLVLSAFVVILNETIMSVALPRLMDDLDITASTAQWLSTGFMLTMAVVIPITGYLLQRFSVPTVFFAAMGFFTLGTLTAAAAMGFGMLLVGRVLQACGTAMMMPLLMTTVLNVVSEDKRGRIMGVISIVISVAPAIGPTVSGLILQSLSWRWIFIIMAPLAILAIILGVVWVKSVTEPRSVPFDVLSIILSAFAFGGLIFGLSSVGEAAEGHAPVPVAIPLTIGSVALIAFVFRQIVLSRTDRALMDLRTFQSRQFTVSIIVMALSMGALFGTLILLPIYLQDVLKLSTLQTGLLLLPGGALMGALAPLVGRLFDNVGPRPLVIPGAFVVSAALWWMTTLGTTTPAGIVIAMHVALSVGLAFMFTPLLTAALGSLQPSLYSHGSAIVGTVQQVAGAAGTALFVTALSVTSISAAQQGASVIDATNAGVHSALMWGAWLSLAAVVFSFLVGRHQPATTESETQLEVG